MTSEVGWIREPDGDQSIENNWLFELRRERFRSRRTGKSHDFYILDLADAVNVVALTPERQVILVRQFRAGSGSDSLETPGGLVDPQEDPVAAGVRELLEETGYAGDEPWVLTTVWSNPSIMTSRTTFLVISNALKVNDAHLDPGEEVELVLVPSAEIPAMLRDGKINHALAATALLWWMAAELPDTPMATLPDNLGPWYQFRIKTLLVLVIISAGVFGLLKNLGIAFSVSLAATCAIPISHGLITRYLDPPCQSVLMPRSNWIQRRSVRSLASFGLAILIWVMILALLKIFRVI